MRLDSPAPQSMESTCALGRCFSQPAQGCLPSLSGHFTGSPLCLAGRPRRLRCSGLPLFLPASLRHSLASVFLTPIGGCFLPIIRVGESRYKELGDRNDFESTLISLFSPWGKNTKLHTWISDQSSNYSFTQDWEA